jgi:hypothetical protein
MVIFLGLELYGKTVVKDVMKKNHECCMERNRGFFFYFIGVFMKVLQSSINKGLYTFLFLFILFITACQKLNSDESNPTTEIVFDKLKITEVLVFKMDGDIIKKLSAYAKSNIDNEITFREIGQWDNAMLWDGLQFSADQKMLFFVTQDKKAGNVERVGDFHLFVVDGNKGKVTHCMDLFPNFRTSMDGGLLLYEDYYTNITTKRTKIFFLYDIYSKKVLKKFTWEMSEDTLGWENIGGFNIIRKPNGEFIIYYPGEGNLVLAAAKINSNSLSFSELWNFKYPKGLLKFPNAHDAEWNDDVFNQLTDPKYQR